MKTLPRSAGYTEERILIKSGISLIAGIDEVGKGALAGPVIAGAVILPPFPNQIWTHGIRDSKLMSSNQRLKAFQKIIRHSVAYNCGISSSIEIDRFGISKATYLAMERALKGLNLRPDFLLIDEMVIHSDQFESGLSVNLTANFFIEENNILSNNLNGTLESGIYQVVNDISIHQSDTLIVEPGTDFLFT